MIHVVIMGTRLSLNLYNLMNKKMNMEKKKHTQTDKLFDEKIYS